MTNLYTIIYYITNGYLPVLLNFLTLLSIIMAVMVIITKNPIVSILYLISLFISIASYLISIGLGFIGIAYLLVYVGAVSILFLFIIMLINIRVSELQNETKNSIPLILLVAFIFDNGNSIISTHNKALHNNIWNIDDGKLNIVIFENKDKLSIITYNNWENNLFEFSHITSIGNVMYTNFSIWLIIASIILLLAMVGSIVVTIKPKPEVSNNKTISDKP